MRRGTGTLLKLLAGLAAAGVAALAVWAATAPSFGDLRRDGDRAVAAVERFRSENGRYPESLAEAGAELPPTRYGPWRYTPDGGGFCLAVGDYARDGFVFYYATVPGRPAAWYANT
jgi:hypothetical protein